MVSSGALEEISVRWMVAAVAVAGLLCFVVASLRACLTMNRCMCQNLIKSSKISFLGRVVRIF